MLGLDRHRVVISLTRVACNSLRHFVSKTTCMTQRVSYKFTHLLQQCRGSTKSIKKLHARIIMGGYEQNPFIASKLITKYSELNYLHMEDARKVFDILPDRDVFLWNVMIQAYANIDPLEVLNIYHEMSQSGVFANQYTFTFMLKSFGVTKENSMGRVIHGHIVKHGYDFDLFVGNALVAFYAKCQEIASSRRGFDDIPRKDIISWNSIISGYTSNGHVNEALTLFRALLHEESVCGPDNATLVSILPACAQASAIQQGLWIHCYIIKTGLTIDAMLGSGLIAMYGNCGYLNSARHLFDQMSEKNIIVWNAMMRCYGMHGGAEEAINLFSKFLENGLCPDGVLFLCLLSACSHAGMVAKGQEIFEQMGDYGVERENEHYACMVDLLGRAGYLMEAVELIKTMPLPPEKDVYGALLGACRMYNNIELAEQVAEKLFVLDPNNAWRYITLAKMYEDVGRLEDAARLRKRMGKNKIKRPFGCSSVEVDCVFHTFGVEDETHPMTMQIFDTLTRLDKFVEEDLVMI